MLFQFLVVFIKLTKFIRKDISVRYKVKMLLAIFFLHSDDIETQSVLSGDLMALWEVVNFLVLIQTFVQIALAAGGAP